MSKRIAIFGAGAAGSYIGAFLTREGHDITLIDMWGEHVDTMNANGLRASGSQGDFTIPVNAVHLADAWQLQHNFDIIFLAMKSYDTEWSSHFVKRLLALKRRCGQQPELHERPAYRIHSRLRSADWLRYVQHHSRPLGTRPRNARRRAR